VPPCSWNTFFYELPFFMNFGWLFRMHKTKTGAHRLNPSFWFYAHNWLSTALTSRYLRKTSQFQEGSHDPGDIGLTGFSSGFQKGSYDQSNTCLSPGDRFSLWTPISVLLHEVFIQAPVGWFGILNLPLLIFGEWFWWHIYSIFFLLFINFKWVG
jgi:hypothetical protein